MESVRQFEGEVVNIMCRHDIKMIVRSDEESLHRSGTWPVCRVNGFRVGLGES